MIVPYRAYVYSEDASELLQVHTIAVFGQFGKTSCDKGSSSSINLFNAFQSLVPSKQLVVISKQTNHLVFHSRLAVFLGSHS